MNQRPSWGSCSIRPLACPLLVVPVLVLLLGSAGCSSSRWRREVLYSRDGVALYKEHRLVKGEREPLGYRHPVSVAPDKVALIMGRLRYEDTHFFRKAETIPVFKPEEVGAAAEPISLSLGVLAPDERLRFLVTHRRWITSLTGLNATTGVMFCTTEGVLQIAFDYVRESIAGGDGGDPRDVSFPYEPTELMDAGRVLPIAGSKPHADELTGQEYPRWLDVELAKVERPPAAQPAAAAAAASQPGASPPVAVPGTAAAPSPPPAAAEPAEEARYQRRRARIEELKRLRADGVLTEEEYAKYLEKALTGAE